MSRREYSSPEEVPTTLSIEHPHKMGVYLPVHRRPVRLPGVDYRSPDCICFVTYRLAETDALLVGDAGQIAWQALLECLKWIGFALYAGCMMPDHVHLLLAPSGSGETISDIVSALKRRQTFRVNEALGIWLHWQRSFYDHVLRCTERSNDEYEAICWYIRNNPVRAGLVTMASDYPFAL